MLRRGFLVFAGLTVSLTAAACSGKGDPPANTSSVVASPPASSTAASASPTVVPIDQIPPGNPAEWVPAGVPTTAKYMEPGDVVPKFTSDLFQKTQQGAMSAALFFITAENWSSALVDRTPELAICDWPQCKEEVALTSKIRAAGQHLVGGRFTPSGASISRPRAGVDADWVVRANVSTSAVKLVDSRGATVAQEPSSTDVIEYYLAWNGKMWRITGKYYVK